MTIFFLITILTFNSYYFQDEDFKIKRTILDWISAWEQEDIEKMRKYYTEDYEYYGNDEKKFNKKGRSERLKESFKNYKEIHIFIDSIKIYRDMDSLKDIKVTFNQKFTSNKFNDYGIKTLRLFKGEETDNEWKIYKEFFEEIKENNNSSYKQDSNSNFGVVLTILIIVIIIVSLIIIVSGTRNSCPSCNKWWAKKYLGRKQIDRKEGYETVMKKDYHYSSKGEQRGYTERADQVHMVYIMYKYFYECKNCNHKWKIISLDSQEG